MEDEKKPHRGGAFSASTNPASSIRRIAHLEILFAIFLLRSFLLCFFGNGALHQNFFGLRIGRGFQTDAPESCRAEFIDDDAANLVEIDTATTAETATLTPDDVKGYGLNTVNAIHFDEDAAKRAGYRAPIIGGGHGVRFLTAAIWKEFAPKSIDVDIYFRRPLFWDDTFDIMVDDRNGKWGAMCLAKDGKVATEMRVNAIGK